MPGTDVFKPRESQRIAINRLHDEPKAGLFKEMGLGKTVSCATALKELIHLGEATRALIVAPEQVTRVTWPDEFRKWSHLSNVSYRLLTGPDWRDRATVPSAVDADIINYEKLISKTVRRKDRTLEYPGFIELIAKAGLLRQYDVLILDESSRIKNSSTKQWKALKLLAGYCDRCWLLTGTPAANTLLDLWGQLYMLDDGKRLFPTMWQYEQRYFESDYMGFKKQPRPGAKQEIIDSISDICLSMQTRDYVDLPPFHVNDVWVDLPTAARVKYEDMSKTFVLELKDTEEKVTAPTAAAKVNKLAQLANGFVYKQDELGHPTKEYSRLHDEKIEALKHIVAEADGPILVAYSYRADLDAMLKTFPEACTIKEPNAVERWNAGKIPMLVGHPASMGHGLNLQHGGHTMAWVGPSWNLEYTMQMNARLLRPGQDRPVICHRILAKNTIDVAIIERLADKKSVQQMLMDALKISRKPAQKELKHAYID